MKIWVNDKLSESLNSIASAFDTVAKVAQNTNKIQNEVINRPAIKVTP